jgi:SAM-dependent methyltransferase
MRRLLRQLGRIGIYDRATHGVYAHGRQLIVPEGQSVYDPAIFGSYDRATQRVVSARDDDGLWTLGLDEFAVAAKDHARDWPDAIQRDRYSLVLPLLCAGSGVCLDACTSSPDPAAVTHIRSLGYEYVAIDIDADDKTARREDVTALSFADDSIARIMSLDTLEHVQDYRQALREFQRVLEPGGVLLLHVPAYFVDRPASAPIDPANDPWQHVRYFSTRELVAEIAATGLGLLRVQLHLDYGAALCVAGKS